MEKELLHKAEKYARSALKRMPEDFHYHDLGHTLTVVEAAYRIGTQSGIEGEDLENLQIAAWFHDLGYQEGIEKHEEESVRIMQDQLRRWGAEDVRIREVKRLILATKMPHQPTDILTKIMCDADLSHLGQPDYQAHSEKLRKEINRTCCKNIQPSEWIRINLEFLKSHRYFTEYGRKVLDPLKKKTLRRISQKLS